MESRIELIGDVVAGGWLPIRTPQGCFLQGMNSGDRITIKDTASTCKLRAVRGLPDESMLLISDLLRESGDYVTIISKALINGNKITDEVTAEFHGCYHRSEVTYDGSKLLLTLFTDANKEHKTCYVMSTKKIPSFPDRNPFLHREVFQTREGDDNYSAFTLLAPHHVGAISANQQSLESIELQNYSDTQPRPKALLIKSEQSEHLNINFLPVVSPNGSWLAFYAEDTSEYYYHILSVMPLDGGDNRVFRVPSPKMAPIWLDDNSLVFLGMDEKDKNEVVFRLPEESKAPEEVTREPVKSLVRVPQQGFVLHMANDTFRVVPPAKTKLAEMLESMTIPRPMLKLVEGYVGTKKLADYTLARRKLSDEQRPLDETDTILLAECTFWKIPVFGKFFRQKEENIIQRLRKLLAEKQPDESVKQPISAILTELKQTEEECTPRLRKFIRQIRQLDVYCGLDEPKSFGLHQK